MNTVIVIAFVVVALAILAACAFLLRQQRAHYESLVKDLRDDNKDLRNRMYVSKSQPPTGTDMKVHQEKQAEARVSRRLTAPKSAPDPTANLRNTLVRQEKRPESNS